MKLPTYIAAIVVVITVAFSQSEDMINRLPETKGKERIELLHEIIVKLWLNYPQQAMQYGEESLGLSNHLGDSVLISKSLRLIAGVHYYKGDYNHSLEYNNKAFAIAVALKDSSLINNGYNNIGLLYYNLGSYQIAFEYLLRAKNIKEKIGETYALSTILNNIGLIFERLSNHEEARNYFEKGYEEAEKTGHIDDQVYSLNNVGITYLRQDKLDTAMVHFRKGLTFSKQTQNINWGAVSLRGIGEILMIKGQLDSATFYFEKSLEQSQRIDDKKGIAEAYYLLSKNACFKYNAADALRFLDLSQEKASQLQLRQQRLDNLKQYAKIYSEVKNPKKEILYLNEYITLRDSLFKDVVNRNVTLIPLKLKEEADRFRLSEQQAEIKNQTLTNQLFTFTFIIIIPLLIILIVLLNKNDKKNKELQRNNKELQRTQKLLITSEKMASLGVLAAGVSHEINNPLNFIKNGIGALAKKIDLEKDEELKSYFKIINEGVDRAANIVKSLSHFSRKGPAVDEKCNVHDIIENCLLILHSNIRNRINVVTNFSEQSSLVKGNEGRLHQAIMNIIANATQAVGEEGKIDITTKRKKGKMEIWIEDDGEGIPEKNLMKISDPFFTTKAPGEGTGLGLFITFSIIEEHNGHIEVESVRGKGTKFTITLPLSG